MTEREFTAPARVNLIGEHTDYTGGLVMPMAIPFTTVARIGPNADGVYRFESDDFDGGRTLDVDDRSEGVKDWTDYPVGVLRQMQEKGIAMAPFTLRLRGDVPLGAGLSSSASVEVATAMALLAHAGVTLTPAEIALLCQRAENVYARSPCGIMDQYVVTAATAGHALLIDTRSLRTEALPMNTGELKEYCVVVANSEVKHSVAGGAYGGIRSDLEAGQAVLVAKFPELQDLGDATLEQVESCGLEDAVFKRCRHVVTENARVRAAREALYAGDAGKLGELMTASHRSERDDLRDSVAEIDFLVETALSLAGCKGARLTGGGFGGCTVNLVETAKSEEFSDDLRNAYRERFGIEAPVYVCAAVDGAVARAASEQEEG